MAAGLPAIISSRCYDVRPVTELSDSGVPGTVNEGGSTIKDIFRTFIGGRFEFYRKVGDMIHLLHNNFLSGDDVDKLLAIAKDIQTDLYSRREQIAAAVQASINDGQPASGSAIFAKLTKMVMSMLAAKPYSVMYGRIRRHGLLPRFREKEPAHMNYCREYLHRFLRLVQCTDFQPWHWCWPGRNQPLYSIMALLQELEDNPFDPAAMETRRLIDLAIYMCGPQANEGIVSSEDGDPDLRPLHEGGSEVWTFIRRARERAWEKAGLDPSLLRCPASAKEIYFDGFPGQFDDIALPPQDVFEDNWLPPLEHNWPSLFAELPVDWEFDL